MHHVVGMPAGRGDGGHVDHRIGPGKGLDELVVFAHVGFDEADAGLLGGRLDTVDRDQRVALAQRQRSDGAADAAAATGEGNLHNGTYCA